MYKKNSFLVFIFKLLFLSFFVNIDYFIVVLVSLIIAGVLISIGFKFIIPSPSNSFEGLVLECFSKGSNDGGSFDCGVIELGEEYSSLKVDFQINASFPISGRVKVSYDSGIVFVKPW